MCMQFDLMTLSYNDSRLIYVSIYTLYMWQINLTMHADMHNNYNILVLYMLHDVRMHARYIYNIGLYILYIPSQACTIN